MAGFAAAAITWALAFWLVRTAPNGRLNVRWALFLFCAGLINLVGAGIARLAPVDVAAAIGVARRVADFGIVLVWVWFASSLPHAPQWPRRRWVQGTALAIAASTILVYTLLTERLHALVRDPLGYWRLVETPLGLAGFAVFIAFLISGTLIAWHAARQAGGIQRRQVRWFAWIMTAFTGFIIFGNVFLTLMPGVAPGVAEITFPTGYVVMATMVAYGIVRHQLFDIDLRLHRGITRATVAAVIAGAAFVGSELVEQAFDVDGTWPAVLIAGGAALAFRPLAALGNRIAGRLLPGVEDTVAYRDRRAQEIYAAAVADAMKDGKVTTAERAVLDGLARNLGLAASDARRLEATT